MSVERFFVDGFGSVDAGINLRASNCFPLVRDLNFKYGLKVIKAEKDTYVMGYDNGFSVCRVSKGINTNGDNVFSYRSPWARKQRGTTSEERETVYSAKVSSLMATLKRMDCVPEANDLATKYAGRMCDGIEQLRKGLGNHSKNDVPSLTGDELHAILLMALGKSPNSDWVRIDQNKCQTILDKFEEKDTIRKHKITETNRFFKNPFYMIGVDVHNHYVVGKFKMTNISTKPSEIKYETIEPFKRYASYEQVPDILPVMTMLKVAYENTQNKQGIIPITDNYDPNLDTVFCYNSRPDDNNHDYVWAFTPC